MGACGPLFTGCLVVVLALLVFQMHHCNLLSVFSSVETGERIVSHFNDGGNHLHEQEFSGCHSLYTDASGGAEDFAVYSSTRILLSAADHTTMAEKEISTGGIFELDLDTMEVYEVPLVGFCTEENTFHPHGISIFRDTPEGPTLLFIVNHRNPGLGDQVLVFQFNAEERTLTHVDTIEDELFVSINDVVAVGLQQFFVTNDSGYPRDSLWRLSEFLFPFTSGSTVVYYDGELASVAIKAGEIAFANGINVSLGGKYLFVAGTFDKELHMYDLHLEKRGQFITSAVVRPRRTIFTNTGLDNIEVDIVDGSLWIGAHPVLAKFVLHAKDNTVPSPSEVVHISHVDAIRAENVLVETVYLSDGAGDDGISASSTASRVGRIGQQFLLVSPVFERKLLLCPANAARAVGH